MSLLTTHLHHLLNQFLQWIDRAWSEFYVKCKQAIQTFNVLVVRVHDIYSNRILNVLTSMQEITLHTFPSGKFFTIALKNELH